ncbi:hypothetical protein, partial [Marinospirillum sp.]|uniref:hypothetical protein n=1 Tax=Marinospirillum sp. TaxID=2183934 RepID=UPI0028706317
GEVGEQAAKNALKAGNGSYHAEGGVGYLPPLRKKYDIYVDNLKKEVNSMQASGASLEEVAAFAHKKRNEIKKPALEAAPPDLLNKIVERNVKIYNNSSGPTFEQLVDSGKTFKQIIESTTRSGGGDIL